MKNLFSVLLMLLSTFFLITCDDFIEEDYVPDLLPLGRAMNQHQKAAKQLCGHTWGGPGKVTIDVKPEGAVKENIERLLKLEFGFCVDNYLWPNQYFSNDGSKGVWWWTDRTINSGISLRQFDSSYETIPRLGWSYEQRNRDWHMVDLVLMPQDNPGYISFTTFFFKDYYRITLEKNRPKSIYLRIPGSNL